MYHVHDALELHKRLVDTQLKGCIYRVVVTCMLLMFFAIAVVLVTS